MNKENHSDTVRRKASQRDRAIKFCSGLKSTFIGTQVMQIQKANVIKNIMHNYGMTVREARAIWRSAKAS